MAVEMENSSEVTQQPTPDPRAAEVGVRAVADVCKTIGYYDLRLANAYQLEVADNPSTLIRLPYPAGFEQRHPKDIGLIEKNPKRYDPKTEQHIKQDPAVRTLNNLARDFRESGRELPDSLKRAYMIRRTIVACMLDLSGHPVTEAPKKEIRIRRL